MRLASPWTLLLLVALIPLLWTWWRVSRRPPVVMFSKLSLFEGAGDTLRVKLRHLPAVLRVLFLVLTVLALARPQSGIRSEEVSTSGVDIVVVLDRSGSMRALDFKPSRLDEAKRTITRFVENRNSDRIGLAVFAAEAYTACPVTLDHGVLLTLVDEVDFARQDEDGTAIGLGLATAVNRLKESEAESRVVVLATDGDNNAGEIDPMTAADLARDRGIRVYTIGIGSRGEVPYPVQTQRGTRIMRQQMPLDEETLRAIADRTGGLYFRADKEGALGEIFDRIDELEKTEVVSEIFVSWSDRFEWLLWIAGTLLLLEVFVLRLLLGRLP